MNRKGIKRLNAPLQDKVRSILCRPQISRGFEGACWFDFDMGPSAMLDMDFSQDWIDNLELCDADNLEEISLEMFHSSSSDLYSNVNMIFRHIIPWESIPKVIKVSAIREATSEQNSAATNISSGRGLNDELLKLSNPHYSAQKDSEIKWRKFIAFVRNVVGDENADVMIPYDASEIQVRTEGAGYLPLASLGTGIE